MKPCTTISVHTIRRVVCSIGAVGTIVALAFTILCFRNMKQVNVLSDIPPLSSDTNLALSIEVQPQDRNNSFTFRGWAVYIGEPIYEFDIQVVLYDPKEGLYLSIPTQMEIRTDVTRHINQSHNDTFDYDASGFNAQVSLSDLNKPAHYQIFLLYRSNGHNLLVDTNKNTWEGSPAWI